MKQEDKDLLLKDLCARLPYGVKVQTTYINQKSKERSDIGIDVLTTVELSMLIDGFEEHKPYLFPLCGMTKKQKEEFDALYWEAREKTCTDFDFKCVYSGLKTDWFNKNHFDYRGLIPMWLALDATGLNIY